MPLPGFRGLPTWQLAASAAVFGRTCVDNEISVRFNPADVAELRQVLSPEQIPQAVAAAINHTLPSGRVMLRKRLQAVVSFPLKTINSALHLRKATRSTLEGAIVVRYRKVPLIQFPETTTSGVLRRLKRLGTNVGGGIAGIVGPDAEGKRVLFPHAFRATLSARPNIFIRALRGPAAKEDADVPNASGDRAGRYPVWAVHGPPVQDVFSKTPGLANGALSDLGKKYQQNLSSQVGRADPRLPAARRPRGRVDDDAILRPRPARGAGPGD